MGWWSGLGLCIPDGERPKADRIRGCMKLGGVVHWAAVAKPTVWPASIVVDAEVLDDDPRLAQGPELFAVEALVPLSAVKTLDETVLPGAGRVNVDGLDLLLRQPALEFLGDKLQAVVGADELRGPMLGDRLLHQRNHVG
jgi:hypothetical protein